MPLVRLGWRDAIGAVAVALVGLACFLAGAFVYAAARGSPAMSLNSPVLKVSVGLVLGGLMILQARRRRSDSPFDAVVDGLQLGAIVIVTESLTGEAEGGTLLALHGATTLIALVAMAIVAQRVAAWAERG